MGQCARAAWQIMWGSPLAPGGFPTVCWHGHRNLTQALHTYWCLMARDAAAEAEQSISWRDASRP